VHAQKSHAPVLHRNSFAAYCVAFLFGAHVMCVATIMCSSLMLVFKRRSYAKLIIRKMIAYHLIIWRVEFDLPLKTAGLAHAKKRKARSLSKRKVLRRIERIHWSNAHVIKGQRVSCGFKFVRREWYQSWSTTARWTFKCRQYS